MYYSSRDPLAAPPSRQLDLFDPERLRLTPEMEKAAEEAADRRYLAYLREQQQTLPPTSHADRKSGWYSIPRVTQKMVRRRSRGSCEDCRKRKPLEFHHLHYRSVGRELPEDLAHLCRECHHHRHWKTGCFVLDPDDPMRVRTTVALPLPATSPPSLVSDTTMTGF
jgi:5-methylcytosine-specific restriction endonuclease McrA